MMSLKEPKARLYLEAHLTLESDTEEKWAELKMRLSSSEWRVSKFDEDEVDGMGGKWFMSARYDYLSLAKREVLSMLSYMDMIGLKVLRWKIEDTVLDSKHGDTEEMLRG